MKRTLNRSGFSAYLSYYCEEKLIHSSLVCGKVASVTQCRFPVLKPILNPAVRKRLKRDAVLCEACRIIIFKLTIKKYLLCKISPFDSSLD